MPEDTIFHHEHWQGALLREFLLPFWRQSQGLTPLPDFLQAQGEVKAEVNQGRWVVDCPAGCGGALVVSELEPFFICYECGSQENGGQWYHVVYPQAKRAIEAQLLKRPVPFRRFFHAANRNWLCGESWQKLRRENVAQGIR
jgi:hypothetical protein|tara:strand:+ start:19072 stop:19497 length:426 start_codon:yes stop_codon:yes gene_type:complete